MMVSFLLVGQVVVPMGRPIAIYTTRTRERAQLDRPLRPVMVVVHTVVLKAEVGARLAGGDNRPRSVALSGPSQIPSYV